MIDLASSILHAMGTAVKFARQGVVVSLEKVPDLAATKIHKQMTPRPDEEFDARAGRIAAWRQLATAHAAEISVIG
ncbi:MAG TPA: hypothetical protein VEI73_00485 [Candidatus Acidoferrum sp.]|nr:hypothetical protein [Candidatus Acidoferrum sp.]